MALQDTQRATVCARVLVLLGDGKIDLTVEFDAYECRNLEESYGRFVINGSRASYYRGDEVWCRFVCQEFNHSKMENVFAGTVTAVSKHIV
eukprot:8797102-Alexandrium_andersonii.AAC.1